MAGCESSDEDPYRFELCLDNDDGDGSGGGDDKDGDILVNSGGGDD